MLVPPHAVETNSANTKRGRNMTNPPSGAPALWPTAVKLATRSERSDGHNKPPKRDIQLFTKNVGVTHFETRWCHEATLVAPRRRDVNIENDRTEGPDRAPCSLGCGRGYGGTPAPR